MGDILWFYNTNVTEKLKLKNIYYEKNYIINFCFTTMYSTICQDNPNE